MFWQQSNLLIGIYSPFKVFSSTEKVSNSVTFARKVCDFKIVILQDLLPLCLAGYDILWRFEIFEVLMISLDKELLLHSQKEISKCF